jgi:hypothetical protein
MIDHATCGYILPELNNDLYTIHTSEDLYLWRTSHNLDVIYMIPLTPLSPENLFKVLSIFVQVWTQKCAALKASVDVNNSYY